MQNNIQCFSNRLYRHAFSLESKENENERMEQNESMEQNEYSEKKSIELKQHEKNCHNEVVDNEMTAPQDLSPR